MEFPCKKCDRDSPWNFHVILCQINDSFVQIHTKFHDSSVLFIQILFVFHAGTWHRFWTSSSHGISMAFAKKMMGFPVRIWFHSWRNCRQKDMRKSLSQFLQGRKNNNDNWPIVWPFNDDIHIVYYRHAQLIDGV